MTRNNLNPPVLNNGRVLDEMMDAGDNHNQVEQQINTNDDYCQLQDASRKSPNEDHGQGPANQQKNERDGKLLIAILGEPSAKGVVQRRPIVADSRRETLQCALPMWFGVMNQVFSGGGD